MRAIATGVVDLVLPVGAMAARLISYHRLERQLRLPPESARAPAPVPVQDEDVDEAALIQVLHLMKTRTGHDVAAYRRATVLRRIARRMRVNEILTLPDYLEVLRTRAGESRALLKDLFVSVTNFFRDAKHFEALAAQIPVLFDGKAPADTVRVWVPGCATGEEAYSIAILLHEAASRLECPPRLRVFASDLDADAIQVGRTGFYPSTIAADVSPERLGRFFSAALHGYRICAELRETVLFATHDVLTDSPFSRVDLVSCRNLLIYFERALRERVLETFHFALRADGLLFLGSSESTGDIHPLFNVVDGKHCLFRRRSTPRLVYALPVGASGVEQETDAVLADGSPLIGAAPDPLPERPFDGLRAGALPSDRAGSVHLRLIERYSPPSLVVDGDFELVHLSQRAGRYLRFGGGEPSRNLLRIAHPMLRIALRAALNRVVQTGEPTEVLDLPVELDGRSLLIDLSVAPADEIAPQCLLVVFNERLATAVSGEAGTTRQKSHARRERELYDEVVRLKLQLRDLSEQYQASAEELQASNEELRTMNEDLRSAGREIDTRRQEARSVNEELATVGVELRRTIDEIGTSNSDLHNVMASLPMAMVFLDSERRITFYTPSAVGLFNLIPTDVGRPLADLTPRFHYADLEADAIRVLRELVAVEGEVGDDAGRWFLARLQPYRTIEEQVAGVVLTFTDITERRHRELASVDDKSRLDERVELLEATLAGLPDRVLTFDRDRRLVFANHEASRHWGIGSMPSIGAVLADLGGPSDLTEVLERQLERCISSARRISGTVRYGRPPTAATLAFTFSPMLGGDGGVHRVIASLRDIVAAPSTETPKRRRD